MSAISLLAVSPASCFPARIAVTISGARKASRTGRVRSRDPFVARDGIERRTVRLEHSLGDFLTSHEQPDQGRIRRGGVRDPIDDELHFFASSLQARGDADSDQSLFGAIRVCVRRSIPIVDSLADTFAQKPADQTHRADIKIDAIRVNLRPDEDGARKIMLRLGRQMFPTGRERSRRVPQPLLHRRIAFPIRDRIQKFDGIGQESAQAADDAGVEIGSRDPCPWELSNAGQ